MYYLWSASILRPIQVIIWTEETTQILMLRLQASILIEVE